MKQIHISDFSQEEFIEFAYLAGLHKRANTLAKALGSETLLKTIQEKYEYTIRPENNFDSEQNKELEKVKSLCSMNELKFLRGLASNLPTGSNILEIGTYLGGTSLALLQGAKYSNCKYTGIDAYIGFPDSKNKTDSVSQCMHWEHLEWQNNICNYSELVTSYHGCSIPVLKDLIKEQKKYDLIFVDTAHQLDSLAEFALIACLANDNCLFVLDDVVDFNNAMTSAWLMSIKYTFSFPRFFRSRYALARPKNTQMPLNFKTNSDTTFEKISEITDLISSKIEEGRKIHTSENEGLGSGFSVNFD